MTPRPDYPPIRGVLFDFGDTLFAHIDARHDDHRSPLDNSTSRHEHRSKP